MDPLSWMLTFIVFLIFFSAFFSASETTLTTVSRHKLKELFEGKEGEESASKTIEKFMSSQKKYLTTILIMNNLVNILASAVSTVAIEEILRRLSGGKNVSDGNTIAVASVIMTILLLIFGEITPKIFARENNVKLFRPVYFMIDKISLILKPLVWFFINVSNGILRVFGMKVENKDPFITSDEIISYLDIGHEEGVIEKHEKFIMQRSLEMREVTTKEIMKPRVDLVAIEDTETIEELVKLINEEGYSRIPVYRESLDTIVGVCYAKDIFKHMQQKGYENIKSLPVVRMMRKAAFVPMTMKVKDVLKSFLSTRTHISIVVDEYGGTAGVVTLEDIIEELMGEIMDEYDDIKDDTHIQRINETSLLLDGTTPINDLERELDIEFPETDYETVSGFILEKLGRFPKPSEKFVYDNFEFEIISVTVNKIEKVKVRIISDDELSKNDGEEN